MANTNAPFGARVVGSAIGVTPTGTINRYWHESANAIYIGDPVYLLGTVHTDGVTPMVDPVSAGTDPLGICVGIEYPDDLNVKYAKASTGMYILVDDSPFSKFEMQADSNASWAAALAGGLVAITATAGSASTGLSAMVLTYGAATTNTLEVRLLRPANIAGQVEGAYMVWECMWNVHQHSVGTGATGV